MTLDELIEQLGAARVLVGGDKKVKVQAGSASAPGPNDQENDVVGVRLADTLVWISYRGRY